MAQQQRLQPPLTTLDNFNRMAGETKSAIFSGLGVNDLKNCRLVCNIWNEEVSSVRLLHSRAVIVHKEDETQKSFWKNLMRAFQLFWGKVVYTVPSFRFKNRVGTSIFLWLSNNHMNHVTSVEFVDCSLYIHQLLLLFRQMPNVNSLAISGIKSMINCKDDMNTKHRDFMKPYYMEESMKNFQKLKKCNIELHQQNQSVEFLELLMLKCNQIEDLRFEFPENYNWQNTGIFTRLGDYLKTLSGTLKVLNVKVKRRHQLLGVPRGRVEDGLGSLDKFLETVHLKQWYTFKLDHLVDLSLDFQLTSSDLPRIEAVLVPFLLTLKSLKKFTFKDLSVMIGEEDSVFNVVPANCRLVKIDSMQRENPLDLADNNEAPIPTDALAMSHMKIRVGSLSWEMERVNWNMEFARAVVLDRIRIVGLTKLDIYQYQVPQQYQFQITDDFLQLIVERATNLVELSFNFCALENLSDFGITGISDEAGQRMRTSGNFEIRPGDQTGFALSRLTKLQILRLRTTLTDSVTDVTARLAFLETPKLRILSLWRPAFSQEGVNALKNIFGANQVIKIDINIGLAAQLYELD